MIDYTGIRALIEGKVATLSLGVDVEYENTFIDPPDSEHIKVINTDIQSNLVCLNGNRLVQGMIIFEIHTKYGAGTVKARGIASTLCAAFVGDSAISGLTFTGEGEFISIGPAENGVMYQHNLMIPYMFEYGS